MCTWRLSNHPLRSSDVLTRRRPSLTRLRQTMAVPRLSSHWTAITSAKLTCTKDERNVRISINQTIRMCPPCLPSCVVGTKTFRSKMLPDSVFFNAPLLWVNISLQWFANCWLCPQSTKRCLEMLGDPLPCLSIDSSRLRPY